MIGTQAGITPSLLIKQLAITKQSLGRALGELRSGGLVEEKIDRKDKRRKPLYLTPYGQEVEKELFARLGDRMKQAYRTAGPASVDGFRLVLDLLLHAEAPRHAAKESDEAWKRP